MKFFIALTLTIMNFPCQKCGLCCRLLNHISQLSDYHIGNGICRYLENNLCGIYDKRPDLCNIEKSYVMFSGSMSEEDYIIKNLKSCIEITEIFGEIETKEKLASILNGFFLDNNANKSTL